MDNRLTVLQEIIEEVAVALYQKWYNAIAVENRTEESSRALEVNARESTLFVIQSFMEKFNNAADELKEK